MTKENLTIENIRKDLSRLVSYRSDNTYSWRISFIIPAVMIAAFFGFGLGWILPTVAALIFAAYHGVLLVLSIRDGKKAKDTVAKKTPIQREDISVSIEKLSHITEETIYEPGDNNPFNRNIRYTKTVSFFYFESGLSWRVPNFDRHYEWSKDFRLSYQGLQNTSVVGDEFYFIKLQTDSTVGYVYNTKLFDLKLENGEIK